MGGKRFGLLVWISFVFCLAGLLASFPRCARADEGEIRQAIRQLADKNAAVRRKALDALVQTRDQRLSSLLKSYYEENLYLWHGQPVIGEPAAADANGKRVALSDPLTMEPLVKEGQPVVVPLGEIEEVELASSQRKAVNDAIKTLALWSIDFEKRLSAIQWAGDGKHVELLPALEEIAKADPSAKIRHTARESIDLIRLDGTFPDDVSIDRVEAARDLGSLHSARGRNTLAKLLKQTDEDATAGKPPDAAARDVYQNSIVQIDRYQNLVAIFDCLKSGLSSGSILVLMALGLAVTFGSMGVINMAHGELMMIGAFTTFVMQQLFVRFFPASVFNWYFVAALPASFLVAAIFGYLIEMLVVRHLYGRPLETLLATLGVSLILIQGVQVIFGYSISVKEPTWLQGNVEVMQDMVVPYNRAFVIVLCVCCVLLFHFIMNYTQYGLWMRATTQNREMAAALGVNTRRIDGYTFALGSGLAGIAGYGLTQIGNTSPDMGQNFIVESFLVVVTGGVGELAGTLYAGMGLGVLNKILEPMFGAVWGQVLVLVAIVLFIQRRPAGLFPPKGRHADV